MMAYAVIGGLFLVLLAVVWLACKAAEQEGRSDAERDYLLAESRTARRANEIDESVKLLSDSDLDRELCDARRLRVVEADSHER
jgi:hypothetical protein